MPFRNNIQWYEPTGIAHYEQVTYGRKMYDIHWSKNHQGTGKWVVYDGLKEIFGLDRKDIAAHYVEINQGKEMITITGNGLNFTPDYSLDCLQQNYAVPVPMPQAPVTMANKQKKETAMNIDLNAEFEVNACITPDERTKSYLLNRLACVASAKNSEAYTKFLKNDEAPKDPKEFVERIKAGTFEFNKNKLNADGSWRDADAWHNPPSTYIFWRATPQDQAAYNAVLKAVEVAEQVAKDEIHVGTPEAGLKILRDFETKNFLPN